MEFSYTDEQVNLRETIVKFARQELNKKAPHNTGTFPVELWHKCAEMQIMSMPLSERYHGSGMGFLDTVIAMNALAYGCSDNGLVHAITTQILCGLQVQHFGDEPQKQNYIPPIGSGEWIAAQAITEPGSGSDAFSMRTKAEKTDDGYILNGTKIFITNGPVADLVIVYAVTNPEAKAIGGVTSFLVEKGYPGFERCKSMEKMGLGSLQNGELVFSGCPVPGRNVLGKEGQGAIIFNESMEWERILLSAVNLGAMEKVLEKCVKYAKERKAFGQQIGKFQAVANKIVDMKVRVELGKLMVFKAAVMKDRQKRATLEASVCKLFIGEAWKQSCLDAVQIHGAYGYMTESEIERELRDSIAGTIYSGTSEMQYNLIAKLLGL